MITGGTHGRVKAGKKPKTRHCWDTTKETILVATLLALLFVFTLAQTTTTPPSTSEPVTSASPTTTTTTTTAAPTTTSTPNSCAANTSGHNLATPQKRGQRQNNVCSGNGYCSNNACVCLPGYEGSECQTKQPSQTCAANTSGNNVASPQRDLRQTPCNGHGTCSNGTCTCTDGYLGADCQVPPSSSCIYARRTVLRHGAMFRQSTVCSGNGYCVSTTCICNSGYSGANCEVQGTGSPNSTTTSPAQNISGNNNAKSANSATTAAALGSLMFACALIAL